MANKVSDEKRQQRSEELADAIEEASRRKDERKLQEEWNKRIEIAREGRMAYERNEPTVAFLNYKKILILTARHYETDIAKRLEGINCVPRARPTLKIGLKKLIDLLCDSPKMKL